MMHIYNMLVGSPLQDVPSKFIHIASQGYVENLPLSRRIKLPREKKLLEECPKDVVYSDVSDEVPSTLKETVLLQKASLDIDARINNDSHTMNPFFKLVENKKKQTSAVLYLTIDMHKYILADYSYSNTLSVRESYGSVDYLGGLIALNTGAKSGSFKLHLIDKRSKKGFTISFVLDADKVRMKKEPYKAKYSGDLRSKKLKVGGPYLYTKVYFGTMSPKDAEVVIRKHAIQQHHQGCVGEYHQIKSFSNLKEAIKDVTATKGIRAVTIIDGSNKKPYLSFRDCKEIRLNYLFRLDVSKNRKPKNKKAKLSELKQIRINPVAIIKSN